MSANTVGHSSHKTKITRKLIGLLALSAAVIAASPQASGAN